MSRTNTAIGYIKTHDLVKIFLIQIY